MAQFFLIIFFGLRASFYSYSYLFIWDSDETIDELVVWNEKWTVFTFNFTGVEKLNRFGWAWTCRFTPQIMAWNQKKINKS